MSNTAGGLPFPGNQQDGSFLSIDAWEKTALNVTENLLTIVTTPVEYVLRPHFGTRYFRPFTVMCTSAMMLTLPELVSLTSGFGNMLSFGMAPATAGLIGIGGVAKAYFLGNLINAPRLFRRMLHMELEQNSEYEGKPLPIFRFLPKGKKFWFVRIVWEPVLVMTVNIVLSNLNIFQHSATTYFSFAAFALAFKNWISWYKSWMYMRALMDAKFAAPIMARIAENKATQEDFDTRHLAGFPKNLPDDIRASTTRHYVRDLSPETERLVTPLHKTATDVPSQPTLKEAEASTKPLKNILLIFLVAIGLSLTMYIFTSLRGNAHEAASLSGSWVGSEKGQTLMKLDLTDNHGLVTANLRRELFSGARRSSFIVNRLTGTQGEGGLTLRHSSLVSFTPGTRKRWCNVTRLDLTPQHNGNMLVRWSEQPCGWGRMILRRVG